MNQTLRDPEMVIDGDPLIRNKKERKEERQYNLGYRKRDVGEIHTELSWSSQ